MSLLDEIEPLKQAALAEFKAAPDLAALEQTKGTWIGPNGKFTALMKQLGTLLEGRKARRRQSHQRRQGRTRSRARRAPRGTGTESRAAEGADRFHLARPPPRARQTASAHAGHRGHRPQLPQDRFRRRRRAGDRGRVSLLRRAQHARRPSRARHAGHVLSGEHGAGTVSPSDGQRVGARRARCFSAPTPPPSKSA